MEETRGITVKVLTDLHSQVKSEQESLEITMSEYITMVLEEHFNKKGGKNMENTRTLAFQVEETLFTRVKEHLARNPKLTQKAFIIGLIEQALDKAETELQAASKDEPHPTKEADNEDAAEPEETEVEKYSET